MRMQTFELSVRFHTPAFVGNADQEAQWRVPPFKAQLRQWWRVATVSAHPAAFDVAAMRRAEGALFGHAWLDTAASKSQVRLRLSDWTLGTLKKERWTPLQKVDNGPAAIAADLYLGYGPVVPGGRSKPPTLKANAAIQPGAAATLRLACPVAAAAPIEQALALMNRFGTVGSRSRNGWGSYSLIAVDGELAPLRMPQRSLADALRAPWPLAIGSDDQGALIWRTAPAADWRAVLVELTRVRIDVNRAFSKQAGKKSGRVEDRHLLNLPVTDHPVRGWESLRLPNSLRFKVRPAPENPEQLIGEVFHLPCLPPAEMHRRLAERRRDWQADLVALWRDVHALLDERPALQRTSEGQTT